MYTNKRKELNPTLKAMLVDNAKKKEQELFDEINNSCNQAEIHYMLNNPVKNEHGELIND